MSHHSAPAKHPSVGNCTLISELHPGRLRAGLEARRGGGLGVCKRVYIGAASPGRQLRQHRNFISCVKLAPTGELLVYNLDLADGLKEHLCMLMRYNG